MNLTVLIFSSNMIRISNDDQSNVILENLNFTSHFYSAFKNVTSRYFIAWNWLKSDILEGLKMMHNIQVECSCDDIKLILIILHFLQSMK